MNHEFYVEGSWQGGRAGVGAVRSSHQSTLVSLGHETGGAGRGINPEEILLQASASCFLATLAIVLEKRGIPFERLDVASSVVFDGERLRVTQITHRPRVVLGANATSEQSATLSDAYHRAEQFCVISNALKGNVEVSVALN